MSAIQNLITANETFEREENRRLLKVGETPLQSLEEAASICQGFEDVETGQRCGDEVPKGVELCPSCERQEQKRLNLEAWARDGNPAPVFYEYLTDRD